MTTEKPKIVLLLDGQGRSTVALVAETYEQEQEILNSYLKVRDDVDTLKRSLKEKLGRGITRGAA